MNIIDTHADTITTLFDKKSNFSDSDMGISSNSLSSYDKKAVYFALWLDKEKRKSPFKSTIELIKFYYETIKHANIIHANDYNSFITAFDNNAITSILGIEGAEAIENDIDNLYMLHSEGVRLITLTWNNKNLVATGSSTEDSGLTPFGKTVIKEMEKLNMIIDVSHLNRKSFSDVMDIVTKPVIASHSNAYDICPCNRNLTLSELLMLRQTNSYVSITLHTPFITKGKSCTINDIILHIDYLMNVIGEDYVSIGTDFDGTDKLPCKISNISDISNLYNLLEKKYNKLIANKIFYLNQLNYLKSIL